MSARILALAGGAIVAMLAAPAAAGPCYEFRLALALEDAASKVEAEALNKRSRDFREYSRTGKSGDGSAVHEHEAASGGHDEVTERLKDAMIAARRAVAVEDAMIAVRRTVADEAAAMIDAMETARNAALRAYRTAVQWQWSLEAETKVFHRSALDAVRAAKHAFRESVRAVCDVRGRL